MSAPAALLGLVSPLGQAAPAADDLSSTVQIVAVIATVLLLLFVIELVRRRRLVERYALIWMGAALAMVVLAVWRGGLDVISKAVGVEDPVNGIFLIAFAVVFAFLLHFSVAISRLSEETKILAQVVARLDAEVRRLRGEGSAANGGGEPAAGEVASREPTRATPSEGAAAPPTDPAERDRG